MKDSDREKLRAVAAMLGIPDDQDSRSRHALDNHDWSRLLRVKDFPVYDPECPKWVPFNLWNVRSGKCFGFVDKLVFSAGAEAFWDSIESVYDHPNQIAATLPIELCQISELWAAIDKRPPAAHREHMLLLKAKAAALAVEVSRLDDFSSLQTGEDLGVLTLANEQELVQAKMRVYAHNLRLRDATRFEIKGESLGYQRGSIRGQFTQSEWEEYTALGKPDEHQSPLNTSWAAVEAVEVWQAFFGDDDGWRGVVPPIAELLHRLASYFEHQAMNPPLKRPSFTNAERNFFAKNICLFFRNSYGVVSPVLVAQLISFLFPQGMSENEVSQMLRVLGSCGPVPENS